MQEGRAFLFFFFLVMVHTTISYSALVLALVVVNSKSSSTTNNSNQLTNQLPLFIFFFFLLPPLSPLFSCLPIRPPACCYLLLLLSVLPSFGSLSHSPTSYNLSMYLTRYTIDDSFLISTSSCRLLCFFRRLVGLNWPGYYCLPWPGLCKLNFLYFFHLFWCGYLYSLRHDLLDLAFSSTFAAAFRPFVIRS